MSSLNRVLGGVNYKDIKECMATTILKINIILKIILFQSRTFFPSKGPNGIILNAARKEFIKIPKLVIVLELKNDIIKNRKYKNRFITGPATAITPEFLKVTFPLISTAPGAANKKPAAPPAIANTSI